MKNSILKVISALAIFFLVIVFAGKTFPTVIGTLLCLLLLAGYYGLIKYSLKFCNVDFAGILKNELPQILFVSAVSVIFIIAMVSSQQTIYIWDSLETWEPTVFCEETTFTDPFTALKTLHHSINHSDYNNFLPMLMALPLHIFGKSFLHYILYVWIMFALPALFLTSAAIKTKFLQSEGFENFSCASLMAVLMLFPVMEVPVLIGYANISILLPVSVIWIMLLNLDKTELQTKQLALISALSIFSVFQARTSAYMIVGCFLGYTFYVAVSSCIEKNLRRDFVMLCKKFFFIGLFAVLMMSPLFFSFLKHAVTYDIGSAYSAYAMGQDFFNRFIAHFEGIGLLIYGIFSAGILLGMKDKNFRTHAIFLLIWTISAVFLFCRIQFMGWQHHCIMILPFAIVVTSFVAIVYSRKKILGLAIIAILTFNFAQTFFPIVTNESSRLFNNFFKTPVRYDIDDVKNFVDDLNQLTGESDRKIFLLASSGLYNSTTLQKIYVPERHEAVKNLLNTNDVDLRDGFPLQFFDADFVVIADPVQVHLRKEDQSVVVRPAELILNPSPISEHFKLIQEYNFQPEPQKNSAVTFKVYEKIKPFEKADIEFMQKTFEEIYPGKDELFKNRFEKYIREKF